MAHNHIILTSRPIAEGGRIDRHAISATTSHWHFGEIPLPKIATLPHKHTDLAGVRPLKDAVSRREFVDRTIDGLNHNEDILAFIHGYHPFQRSIHLELVHFLHKKYIEDPGCRLKKVLFISWPNRGPAAQEDEESNGLGKKLKEEYLADLANVKQALAARGGRLHLMAQSHGNQYLNGFITAFRDQEFSSTGTLFQNVFLMASDVPHESVRIGGTVVGNENRQRHYGLDRLKEIAGQVVVFHDPKDPILAMSRVITFQSSPRLGRKGLADLSAPERFEAPPLEHYYSAMPNFLNIPFFDQKGKNLRHQYFHSNPRVVELIKRYVNGTGTGAAPLAVND